MSTKPTTKAPWFKFYVQDFFMGTLKMSSRELGVYIRLLCWQWEYGPIDIAAITFLNSLETKTETKQSSNLVSDLVIDSILKLKFRLTENGTWINDKLERIRVDMEKKSKVARENGSKGGRKKTRVSEDKKPERNQTQNQTKNPDQNPGEKLNDNLLRSSDTQKLRSLEDQNPRREPIGSCGELVPSSPPAESSGFTFVLADRSIWPLSKAKLAEFEACFPSMDVGAELRKAAQWLVENPTRRKTSNGMGKYLLNWLSKAQNSGRAPSRSGIHDPVDPRGNLRAAGSVLAELSEFGNHDTESEHGQW